MSPLDCKEIKPVNPKGNQPWIFIGRTDAEAETNTLATWRDDLTPLKRPWCWERLKAGGEGDERGWDGWMASMTQWTWVWANSRSWWWTGRPGMLQSMGLQSWTWLSDWTELTDVDRTGSHLLEEWYGFETRAYWFQNYDQVNLLTLVSTRYY